MSVEKKFRYIRYFTITDVELSLEYEYIMYDDQIFDIEIICLKYENDVVPMPDWLDSLLKDTLDYNEMIEKGYEIV